MTQLQFLTFKRGQWRNSAYYPEGHKPSHFPPNEAPEGWKYVWVPNDMFPDNNGAYDRWGYVTTNNVEKGDFGIHSWVNYDRDAAIAAANTERAAVSKKTVIWSSVLVGIAMVILGSWLVLPSLSFGPAAAHAALPTVEGTPTPLLPEDSPNLVVELPEDSMLADEDLLPAQCKEEGTKFIPMTVTSLGGNRMQVTMDQEWYPLPEGTYCVQHPAALYKMFTRDSSLADLKDWDITHDSSWSKGGSLLRQAATMWGSKYRMSIKATNREHFLSRWNEAYYLDMLGWLEAYAANPGVESNYLITFSSEAREDDIDRERLLNDEDLPLPPAATPTPLQPPVMTAPPTFTPTVTATLYPTLVMEVLPTLKPGYTSTAVPGNNSTYPGGGGINESYPTQHPNYSDVPGNFLQNDCVEVYGTTEWSSLNSFSFVEMTIRTEDDGRVHGYSQRVSYNDQRYKTCILDIRGMPDPLNIDGKGSKWGTQGSDGFRSFGQVSKSPLGNFTMQLGNSLWASPIIFASGQPTVTAPESTVVPPTNLYTLDSMIAHLQTTNLYEMHTCTLNGKVATMSQGGGCVQGGQYNVDWSAVWDLLDHNVGQPFIVRSDRREGLHPGVKASQYGNTNWYYGPLK